MLHLRSGQERMRRVSSRIDPIQPDLYEIFMRCRRIGEREQLNEWVATVDSSVLHEVAVVEKSVRVTHYVDLS